MVALYWISKHFPFFPFLQNPRFRKSRQRQGKEGGGKGREKGRGRSRARPGLGATPDVCISVVCLKIKSLAKYIWYLLSVSCLRPSPLPPPPPR